MCILVVGLRTKFDAVMARMKIDLRLTIYSGMLFAAQLQCVLTARFNNRNGIGYGILATVK